MSYYITNCYFTVFETDWMSLCLREVTVPIQIGLFQRLWQIEDFPLKGVTVSNMSDQS